MTAMIGWVISSFLVQDSEHNTTTTVLWLQLHITCNKCKYFDEDLDSEFYACFFLFSVLMTTLDVPAVSNVWIELES